jgi:hypothetical protein
VPLMLLAFEPRGGDGLGLGIDRGGVLQQVLRLAMHDRLLLVIEQREHFAVLLQLFPKGFNEILQQVFHELTGKWSRSASANARSRGDGGAESALVEGALRVREQ